MSFLQKFLTYYVLCFSFAVSMIISIIITLFALILLLVTRERIFKFFRIFSKILVEFIYKISNPISKSYKQSRDLIIRKKTI